MRVFVTGATGWVGSAIVQQLLGAGHQVLGLVRSDANAQALAAAGGTPLLGSLNDLDSLRRGASQADGIIHTAFGLDLTDIAKSSTEEQQAIEALGEVLAGSDRPLIVTSGLGFAPAGQVLPEAVSLPKMPGFPRDPEQALQAVIGRGVRATVVRLPRTVHGANEQHGFMPMLIRAAREKGVSAYVGDGQNLWPAVHRLDAARVFCLALEHGAQGGPFHAVAEEGIPFKAIAEAIGQLLNLPVVSQSPEEANAHFGPIAMFVAGNGPASSEQTRARLGWQPTQPGLLADLADYAVK
ncbi:SDR family oxidoreductase [Hymenobacter cheonanensis]|uniref:SDR family oxidoreductase n=1 Tax=Hymenobacter sp. CA2-7 TaxID=3063993 RepID=UPI0027139A40|nr:SDR family oxidoreductase [Hymenobacter sp. CA2-7]MDO7885923.1 SDR family oxidoreductase [Hymenobacter sp. CA2-7]